MTTAEIEALVHKCALAAIRCVTPEKFSNAVTRSVEHALTPLSAALTEVAREMDRWEGLRTAIRDLLHAEENWPSHGNAPLAIAASFVLLQQRAEAAERERDYWKDDNNGDAMADEIRTLTNRAEAAEAKLALAEKVVEAAKEVIACPVDSGDDAREFGARIVLRSALSAYQEANK